ncbi:GFA family protein [uncultured Sphingomonas sp.]|uniref:GFA family protein n=1 Tax=uncultured Sphingomonas sp. TaxID=158754 RepID=UPI002598E5D4|nr:GFA family protein [uncultured Sphingomonas sp.]
MSDDAVHPGGCHCGAVRFAVRLTGGLAAARRCDCSYCRMRGAVALTARVGDLEITSGADQLSTYRFNTGTAEHHFCRTCGIYTHHRRRSNGGEFGVNAACLDGISPFDFREVPVNHGIHHPSDGGGERIAGILRYEPIAR